MSNSLEEVLAQIKDRETTSKEKLIEATKQVFLARGYYCKHLKVITPLMESKFDPIGFECGLMTKQKRLNPEAVCKLCSQQCHECPEYVDYQKSTPEPDYEYEEHLSGTLKTVHYDKYGNVQSIDLEYDPDIIEPAKAKLEDIEAFYEHKMKEGFSYYDEDKIAEFYNERPSIDRYNQLVWAFKSSGLKAGDSLEYAIPYVIMQEENR